MSDASSDAPHESPIDVPHDRHPVALYLARFARGSHRSVHHALRVIATLCEAPESDPMAVAWTDFTQTACAQLRTQLLARYARATAHRVLLVLRGVLREAAISGQMDLAVYQTVEGVRRITRARGVHVVKPADVAKLFESCRDDVTPAGCRDAAVLALVYAAGVHRSAAVALDREAYLSDGTLVLGSTSRRLSRTVKLSDSARDAVDAWLRLRGDSAGPLLCPVNKAGRIQIRRMSDQALYLIIVRRSQLAGVRLSPNELRRPYLRRQKSAARARKPGTFLTTPIEVSSSGLEVPFVGCGPSCPVEDPRASGSRK